MLRDRNLDRVARVAERLSQSSEEFAFVGGAIVGLLTTDALTDWNAARAAIASSLLRRD